MRVIRAFFKALWLTLQGKTYTPAPKPPRYPLLEAWRAEGVQRLYAALSAADKTGLDEAARRAFTLTLDSRPISMETILRAVEHNLTREYPLLMETRIEHNLTTLYALNLNDRYRAAQLAAALSDDPARAAVQRLSEHLDAIPSSQAVQETATA
ncbi:MAG: hypothetical protein SNJ54_08910 [Anaerolineae bacterium]